MVTKRSICWRVVLSTEQFRIIFWHIFWQGQFWHKITEILSQGNIKYFRDGAFRIELCLYIYHIYETAECGHFNYDKVWCTLNMVWWEHQLDAPTEILWMTCYKVWAKLKLILFIELISNEWVHRCMVDWGRCAYYLTRILASKMWGWL